MSSATPSRQAPLSAEEKSIIAAGAHRIANGVRAGAFWIAAILPIFVLASIIAGVAGRHPEAFLGALALNALCVIVGHNHKLHR